MAAGDLITRDGQYQLGELLMGPGTQFAVQRVSGLGMPNVRPQDSERVGEDGDLPGEDYLGSRSVSIELGFHDDAPYPDFHESVDMITAEMTVLRRALKPFAFRLPGRDVLFCEVRPRRYEHSVEGIYLRGMTLAVAELYAPNPRIWEVDESDHSFILSGGSTSTQNTFPVGGLYPSRPVVEIEGPARNPRLTNVTDGSRALRLDMDIQATDTLVVDMEARTVELNGADVYEHVRHDSEWWELVPNVNNSLIYSRSSAALNGADSSVSLVWRNARISV